MGPQIISRMCVGDRSIFSQGFMRRGSILIDLHFRKGLFLELLPSIPSTVQHICLQ